MLVGVKKININTEKLNELLELGEIPLVCAADMRAKISAHANGYTSNRVANGKTGRATVQFPLYFGECLWYF